MHTPLVGIYSGIWPQAAPAWRGTGASCNSCCRPSELIHHLPSMLCTVPLCDGLQWWLHSILGMPSSWRLVSLAGMEHGRPGTQRHLCTWSDNSPRSTHPILHRTEEISTIIISGRPITVSCAYTGRIAIAYRLGGIMANIDNPNNKYINLHVSIYECESTGKVSFLISRF